MAFLEKSDASNTGLLQNDAPERPRSGCAADPVLRHGQHAVARSNILIIEDYKAVHDLIRSHLVDEPYDFLSAFDAVSGISMAKSAAVDLVLLDLDLPDINGFDVCRELKAHRNTADIAVIFLTASTGFDEKEVGMSLDASDYITKPFDPRELSIRVRSALRVKRLLDLLPAADRENGTNSGIAWDRDPHLALRLSLPKVIRARQMNPWRRRRPGSDQ
jgi:PleD family two-component response regulator